MGPTIEGKAYPALVLVRSALGEEVAGAAVLWEVETIRMCEGVRIVVCVLGGIASSPSLWGSWIYVVA